MKGDTEEQIIWFVLTLEVEDEFTTNVWRKLYFLKHFHQKINKHYLFVCFFPSVNEKEHNISTGTHTDCLKHRHMLSLMLMCACLAVDM